jgi:hypothetical protein
MDETSYGWPKDGGGDYGSTAVLGNWLAGSRTDSVAPKPPTVGTTVTLTDHGLRREPGRQRRASEHDAAVGDELRTTTATWRTRPFVP